MTAKRIAIRAAGAAMAAAALLGCALEGPPKTSIRNHVKPCWPTDGVTPRLPVVTVEATIGANGVVRSVRPIDEPVSRPIRYKAAVRRATQAFEDPACQPLPGNWVEGDVVIMTFDPARLY